MTGTWSPVALSADLPTATAIPVATTFGALALWRSKTGVVSAFADRCPHRGMRLSHGFVRGEALSCIYHGWGYGTGGECLRIPAHPGLAPPNSIRVARFPVEEAAGIVFVAESQPERGPPSLSSFAPLRSLTADAPAETIGRLGTRLGDDGFLEVERAGSAFVVLLARQAEDRTLIHVLVPAATDTGGRIAASRGAEMLRREAEDAWRKDAA